MSFDKQSPYRNKFLNSFSVEDQFPAIEGATGQAEFEDEMGFDPSSEEDVFKAMEIEQAKGDESDAPEQALAATSLMKDLKTKGGLTREDFDAAISGEQGNIAQKKAALYKALEEGSQVSSSQAVGLGVLALGLMAAGAAIKGKKGLAAGAGAFNAGSQVYLADKKVQDANRSKSILNQIDTLDKQEGALNTAELKSKLAPLENEEKISAYVERLKRAKEAGVQPTGNTTKINMPDSQQNQRLEGAQEAVYAIDKIESLLKKEFPLELKDGETYFDAALRQGEGKISSQGAQKRLNASLQGVVRANAKSLGANPSNQDVERIVSEMTGGNIYSIKFLAESLASMKDDARNRVNVILNTGETLREDGGFKTDPAKLGGKSDKKEKETPSGMFESGQTLNLGNLTIKVK